MLDSIKAGWKFILSFRKRTWDLEDYPIRLRRLDSEAPTNVGKAAGWTAQIINWWQISGFGPSQEEALSDLRAAFADRRLRRLPCPRPGRPIQLEFAPQTKVQRHGDLARHFFRVVLNMDYEECFVSDESSLLDFEGERSLSELLDAVRDVYGIDVHDLEYGNLVTIFDRIAVRGVKST